MQLLSKGATPDTLARFVRPLTQGIEHAGKMGSKCPRDLDARPVGSGLGALKEHCSDLVVDRLRQGAEESEALLSWDGNGGMGAFSTPVSGCWDGAISQVPEGGLAAAVFHPLQTNLSPGLKGRAAGVECGW